MTKDDPLVFVGMRVADMPTPYVPSVNWTCSECREAVWVSKKMVKDAFAADTIVCSQCALKLLEAERQQ
jgi:hypothetical protein